jgi:hypothetical protein
MTRLFLALVLVAVLLVGLAILALGFRAALNETMPREGSDNQMQKIAYALLVALIFYVAFQGGAA